MTRQRLRPCPTCGRPRRGDHCTGCGWTRKSPSTKGVTWRERQRRAEAVRQHRETYGDWCPGWMRPGHPATDLTADHLAPVAAGGGQGGQLRVLCRPCNSSRGARP